MATQAADILPRLGEIASGAGIALLSGTAPSVVGAAYVNRATLFLPDGRVHTQDKLSLTPDERDPEAWSLEPGDVVRIVVWRGLRLAVVICLDIEQPALAARLQGLDLDVVLVPTDTGFLSGHLRVFSCAKARAVELFCSVAPVGGVGTIPRPPARPNVSGAAVYMPCERAFGATGTLADTGPRDQGQGAGDLVIVRDLPVGRLRHARRQGGEVWNGAWSADGLRVEQI
jgi:predicted amidohydrolase